MANGQSISLRRQLRQGLASGLPAVGQALRIGIDPDGAAIVGA